jgi:monofunctional chorismate mutase
MKDLNKTRGKIENIDRELISLFEERMHLVKDVATYKIAHNMQVLDESREKDLIAKNRLVVQDDEIMKYYEIFYKSLMDVSKTMQKDLINKAKEQ